MKKLERKLLTHNGSFHTDDIFACATLALVLESHGEKFKIVRTRDEKIINEASKDDSYVFDVGGVYDADMNKFDHHQKGGAGKRQNGIEYSSFGLVWQKFGVELAGSEVAAKEIDDRLVAPIDASDNGMSLFDVKNDIGPFLIQDMFGSMRPTWKEGQESMDKIFLEAVKIAKGIILRSIVHVNHGILAEKEVTAIYKNTKDKRIIVLYKNYPFEKALEGFSEPLFVIYPREDTFWSAKAMRVSKESFKNRKDFPASWAGLKDEDLQKVSGIPDAVFCHRALFIAVARSREGAIKLAQIAVES